MYTHTLHTTALPKLFARRNTLYTHMCTHADPHSGTGSGNERPSSSGGGATGNVPPGGEEEPKSLDPFAAMGEENRRLQSKRNSSTPHPFLPSCHISLGLLC